MIFRYHEVKRAKSEKLKVESEKWKVGSGKLKMESGKWIAIGKGCAPPHQIPQNSDNTWKKPTLWDIMQKTHNNENHLQQNTKT